MAGGLPALLFWLAVRACGGCRGSRVSSLREAPAGLAQSESASAGLGRRAARLRPARRSVGLQLRRTPEAGNRAGWLQRGGWSERPVDGRARGNGNVPAFPAGRLGNVVVARRADKTLGSGESADPHVPIPRHVQSGPLQRVAALAERFRRNATGAFCLCPAGRYSIPGGDWS